MWQPYASTSASALASAGSLASLFGIDLFLRRGLLEGWQCHASGVDACDCRVGRQVHAETGVAGDLCNQADVGEPRSLAVAECSGLRRRRQELFKRTETFVHPVAEPVGDVLVAGTEQGA